jgi:hypothetical protein
MAIAGTVSIITDLPAEGLPLREALKLSPFWSEHHRTELLRFRIQAGAFLVADSEKLQLITTMHAAWSQLIEWLFHQLENGVWTLKAYRSEKLWGEPEAFDSAVVRHLFFDKDYQTVRGPNGQMFYSPRIYSTTTMVPKVKEPLTVTIKGPVVLAQEHRGKNAEIIKAAEEEFPDGWRTVKPQTLVVNSVLNRMGWDSSKRDTVLRALGWRKG